MDTNPIEAQNETDNVPLQLGITAFVHYEPSGSLKLEFQSGHEDKGYKVIVWQLLKSLLPYQKKRNWVNLSPKEDRAALAQSNRLPGWEN